MNQHVFTSGAVALGGSQKLADVVAEYEAKLADVDRAIADFAAAGDALKAAATIRGTYGDTSLDVGSVYETEMKRSLSRSAWKHVYEALNIGLLASPRDKKRFQQSLAEAPPFTFDNVVATFGDYVKDPRRSILRAFAEVFCDLDPYYKSHEKMKVGVKGLPKRIVIGNVGGFGSYGKEKLEAVLNALAAFEGKPLVTWREIEALLKREDALLRAGELAPDRTWDEPARIVGRGVRLRRFGNGNGHLFFEPEALRSINLALAEYYGDVLPDCEEERPRQKSASTAVAKDLQYYPTPKEIVERVVRDVYQLDGARVLEPQCGCGRILDALRAAGARAVGIEVHMGRAAQAKAKGHQVFIGNFLDTEPTPTFDHVVMNPPFYGKHYAKHVRHALKFLKPGGTLTAILPATARYDHGLLDDLNGRWEDLPVGSFAESGTCINVSILKVTNRT